jgi:hypothetical protein
LALTEPTRYNASLQALEEREAPFFDTFCQLYNVVYKQVGYTSKSVTPPALRTHLIIVYNASTPHL